MKPIEDMTPKCKCGKPCAYYGPIGAYSVKCIGCNAKNAKRQRDSRKAKRRAELINNYRGPL